MNGGVRSWGKHFFVYGNESDDEREVTHLCLDGGKLSVPFDKVSYFHRKLGVDISREVKNYIVERRTPVFKFHADLDIFEPNIKPYFEILNWIRDDILSVLREFYPDIRDQSKSLCVFVCTTDAKSSTIKYGTEYSKVGVHLLFPWLLIDTPKSMNLRSAFIQYFTNKYNERDEGYNAWADVFDKTVYTSNGLRMLGCGKMERCKDCKGKYDSDIVESNSVCRGGGKCGGFGKYDIGRIYKIETVLNGDGTENVSLRDELLEDEIEMTNVCSIRCDPNVVSEKDIPNQTFPDWFDPDLTFDASDALNSRNQYRIKKVVKVREHNFDSFVCLQGTRVRLSDSDRRVKKIKEWFKNDTIHDLFRLPKAYRNSRVIDVIMCCPQSEEDRYYLINVDSHYCMNIQREHNSNGIYFTINEQGLFQKCFCRCDTTEGRLFGKCENFSSQCFPLPDDLAPLLFSLKDDKIKSQYSKFVEQYNKSLCNIKTESDLKLALFDRILNN